MKDFKQKILELADEYKIPPTVFLSTLIQLIFLVQCQLFGVGRKKDGE